MTDQPPRNQNRIVLNGWSNPDSRASYEYGWPMEPKTLALYHSGRQCLDCQGYAAFNEDWGLCVGKTARHFTETVFEHFTCPWWSLPGSMSKRGWQPSRG